MTKSKVKLHRKKIDIYANISLFPSYSEVTVATRSGPYPAQMVTAVTRSSPYPDELVDHHLETTSAALNDSGVQDWPPTEPGFSQGFFSILSPMEFWFLAALASGLLMETLHLQRYHRLDCTDTI